MVIMMQDVLVLFIATLFTDFVGCWIVSFLLVLILQGAEAIM